MMNELYQQVLERNARETTPFISIHQANASLLIQIDALQSKCEGLERDIVAQQQLLEEAGPNNGKSYLSQSAALKNETRLRDKLEKLQEELNDKLKIHSEEQAIALKSTKELAEFKDLKISQEGTISELRQEDERKEHTIEHLTTELVDAKSRTKLAEQQYVGLKDSIRVLQDENDLIKKENRELETRFVSEKEQMSNEMNVLTEMVDRLKKEVDMLRALKVQEDKRTSWFGQAAVQKLVGSSPEKNEEDGDSSGRKWGSANVILPSKPMHILQAHKKEASCVRYDASGTDLIATGSSDSTVKVWDSSNASLKATLRGGTNNAILACDISNGIAVGGGTDKTCRVWDVNTERMVHHLVGHAHKITCVRLFGGERGVITGSADRSLKVWDISRRTYNQTTTMHHSSTANCLDVGIDSFTVVSGHLDGGLRFWDVRTGERTADISNMHEGAVTSVQFHPIQSSQVLTSGMDSCLKIVDIRTCSALHTLRHPEFQTTYGWASSCFSPDGKYVASGSSATGKIFVWDTAGGELKKKLDGHEAGVYGFAWGRGGTSGQQVASVDRDGTLILWA